MKTTEKMYLILREDLAFKYIQGAHALAEFSLKYPKEFKKWNNQYLICLSVFNGLALRDVYNTLKKYKCFKFVQFIEPDLKSKLPTAICLRYDDRNDAYCDGINYLNTFKLATK